MSRGAETALVTGASSGIGLELARCFAASGSDVVLAARNADVLEKVAAELATAYGARAIPIACDLSTPHGARALIDAIAALDLTIDVVVNSAATGPVQPIAEADLEEQLGIVDLNVRSLTELTVRYWPGMVERGRGGVLNVGSLSSFAAAPFVSVYGASKAYVLSFTEALWEEARGTGVNVSCLCPGATRSNFHQRAGWEKYPGGQARRMAANRVAAFGYEAFRANRRLAIPGFGNRLGRRVLGWLPDNLLLRIMRNAFSN